MTAPDRRPTPALPPDVRRVHLVGICGTGMGSLAGMFKERGFDVRGSDQGVYPPMSTWLAERAIPVMEGFAPEHLDWGPDLIVVGNICRRDNAEAGESFRRGIPAVSMAEAVRLFFLTGRRPLVVTGTHGKTTTSSLLAFLLHAAGLDPGFMIGGVVKDFGGNYRLGGGAPFVVEGDEYDTAWFDKVPKFWHYEPLRATINNIEFDHGDIYPDLDAIRAVFRRFAALIDPAGSLWVNGDDPRALEAATRARCPVRTFGLTEGCALHPTALDFDATGVTLALTLDGRDLGAFRSPLPGEHNVRNLMGALAIALDEGADLELLRAALPAFLSVKKRQELRGEAGGVMVFDDFAHHPTAVRETLAALRRRFPDRTLHAAFEAKSNTSRMSIFQTDYLDAFRDADTLVLSAPWKKDDHLDPTQRIDLHQLAADLTARGLDARFIPDIDAIADHLATTARPGDIILAMSGSNFGGLHDKLLKRLTEPRSP